MVWCTFYCERCKKEIMTPTIEYSDMCKFLYWCSRECFQLYLDQYPKCGRCHHYIIYNDYEKIIDGIHYCNSYCADYRDHPIKERELF